MKADRPVVVYDDDCGFCTWCTEWIVRHGAFDAVGFANVTPQQRSRLPADFTDCAHLLTDTEVYSCGEAVEEALIHAYPALQRPFGVVGRVPGYTDVRERLYDWVADHRAWFGRICSAEPPVESDRRR
ncbi:thiol-disulfide oxidoreductase DCC family protein [Halocatena salina]|uniref:DUF393 domain-containing protein n=1 Tax=Halocatena salina TaxID=2934340 RepID=A0A8T9ZZ27_9EURY|nr:DUF393 domain-containing protein [Halocatena salina]UPM42000.1 DUF393 domain-containing protein [Halocatena salina]